MVVTGHIRALALAVASLSLLAHQVAATSTPSAPSFSSCITSCIKADACETSDTKCMCKGAKSDLLTDVAQCMYYVCPNELRTFDNDFLTPLVSVCSQISRNIPETKIQEATETAELFVDKLPATTTSKAATTSAKATVAKTSTVVVATTSSSESKKTTVAATTSSTSKAVQTSTSTSTSDDDDDDEPTTTSSEEDSATTTTEAPRTTLATTTSSPTRAVSSSSTSTSTKSASRSDPTDSSPFAKPPGADSAGGRSMTGSWGLAGLPALVALAVVMR